MLQFLRDELGDWSYFDAKCLPVPFGFAEWLVAAADQLQMSYEIELQDMTAVLALPGSFDEYCDHLAPKKRHELRRKARRFDQLSAETIDFITELERVTSAPRVVNRDALRVFAASSTVGAW